MNKGKYVLSQRLYFLDRNDFNYLARKYGGDKYVKQFTCCYNQLCVLMFGQLSNRESLRDVVLATQAHVSKAYHLGFSKHAAKSALADANTKQDLCTLPMDIVRKTLVFTPKNAFATFLSKIFCEDTAKALFEKYHIGTTKDGRTIFYQFDTFDRCRAGKIIPYNPETGHRIKDDHFPPVMWVHTNLKAVQLLQPEWRLTQCLFGEHLLQGKVNANVALVESEKTAVICSLLLPEYVWLATGGKSQFNDRLMVLKGRKVTAFPDIDGYDEWRKKAKNYPMLDIVSIR